MDPAGPMQGACVLPDVFCWTRFGTEAGQAVEAILARKEEERHANGGVFLWGIGNAVGPSLRRLLELVRSPEVLFSPIHSSPRREDVDPSCVAAWTEAEALDGSRYCLPASSLVTSAWKPGREAHYALVCRSEDDLREMRPAGSVNFAELKNLVSGQNLGSSQTTAVVRRDTASNGSPNRSYMIAIRAQLVFPYFLRLTGPVPLGGDQNATDWQSVVAAIWAHRKFGEHPGAQRLPLVDQGS